MLVLEQMQQQAVHPLRAGSRCRDATETMRSKPAPVERFDDLEQTLVNRGLGFLQRGNRAQGSGSAKAAGPSVPPSIAST
jgi:hypothetical protein